MVMGDRSNRGESRRRGQICHFLGCCSHRLWCTAEQTRCSGQPSPPLLSPALIISQHGHRYLFLSLSLSSRTVFFLLYTVFFTSSLLNPFGHAYCTQHAWNTAQLSLSGSTKAKCCITHPMCHSTKQRVHVCVKARYCTLLALNLEFGM